MARYGMGSSLGDGFNKSNKRETENQLMEEKIIKMFSVVKQYGYIAVVWWEVKDCSCCCWLLLCGVAEFDFGAMRTSVTMP